MVRVEQPVTIKISGVGKTITFRSEDFQDKPMDDLMEQVSEAVWHKLFPRGRYRCRITGEMIDTRTDE